MKRSISKNIRRGGTSLQALRALALGGSVALVAWLPLTIAAGAADAHHGQNAGMHVLHPKGSRPRTGGTALLAYQGGVGGSAVLTGAHQVYLVEWGFNGIDPSGEVARQRSFFAGVGGSSWNGSVTQYCQGSVVAVGATVCPSGATFATNPSPVYIDDPTHLWVDDGNALPGSVTQSALAAEATRAAAHFGNMTATSNTHAQYVIDTPSGHSTSGFGTQFCAWHSSTSSSYGNIAYTNFPYITDAGASCGANFVNAGSAGALDGVTIVGGHEFAETETDIFPNGGWLDRNGQENGDKCAWISSGTGAARNITLSTGSFAVQSLWSNAAAGCVSG